MEYTKYLINFIVKKVKLADKKGVILGISGGVDSACLAWLAKQAFPKQSLTLFMPIETNQVDSLDVQKIIQKIDIKSHTIDLTPEWKKLTSKLKLKKKLGVNNLKARLRMITLYALAQEYDYLVLGSSNLFELILGYFTKFGDGAADLFPLINLTKSQIINLAKKMQLPQFLQIKAPSAGLYPGQTDEQELGFSYQTVDKWFKNQKIKQQDLNKIKQQIRNTKHKRTKFKILKPNHKKFTSL